MALTHFGFAMCERAGFVDTIVCNCGRGFEVLTTLDEYAGTRRAGNRGHDGGRGGQNQRTRAGDDQYVIATGRVM